MPSTNRLAVSPSARRAVLASAITLMVTALAIPTSAFATPPGLVVLVKENVSRLVSPNDVFKGCAAGPEQSFQLRAWSPDPLGFPIFEDLGIDTPIKVFWDFGSATPQSPLDAFSLSPTVTFSENHSSTVTVTVYGTNGESSSYTFTAIADFAGNRCIGVSVGLGGL